MLDQTPLENSYNKAISRFKLRAGSILTETFGKYGMDVYVTGAVDALVTEVKLVVDTVTPAIEDTTLINFKGTMHKVLEEYQRQSKLKAQQEEKESEVQPD